MQRLTLEHVVVAVLVVAALAATASPIRDNSMLLHLQTGIELFRSGEVPTADPYSFTARGEPWVVQSWLAGWTYGALHALGGATAVIFLQMVLTGLIALVMALLARTGSMARTTAAAGLPVALAFTGWAQRPLLYGLLAFALVVFVVHRRRSPLLLIPIVWLWVNTHGSFPIGLAWIGAVFVGDLLDRRKPDVTLLKYAAGFIGGVLLGAINPVGWKLITFWTSAFGEKREVFARILEWGSPDFQSFNGAVVLLSLAGSFAVLLHARVPWRHALPVMLFFAAALYSARYLGVLAIVLCPAMAAALTPRDGDATATRSPETKSDTSPIVVGAAFALVALIAVSMFAKVAAGKEYNFAGYPVAAVEWMKSEGLLTPDRRVATQDFVGGYLIFAEDGKQPVFIDDRYDMFPVAVADDYSSLVRADADVIAILDRYGIDHVLWSKTKPLTQVLSADDSWVGVWQDDDWAVFSRA